MSAESLVFRAGSQLCALPLADVVETMRPLPVRPLAGMPPHVLGISVVRGTPVPVIDVAELLGAGDVDTAPTRFVVIRAGAGQAALATGPVVGIETLTAVAEPDGQPAPVSAVAVRDSEPLLALRGAALVPEVAWTAAPSPVAGTPS